MGHVLRGSSNGKYFIRYNVFSNVSNGVFCVALCLYMWKVYRVDIGKGICVYRVWVLSGRVPG